MKDRILEIMKKEGMTQQEFSRATGISPASLSSIFNGRTAPTMKHAEALHRHFPTLSMDWLLFGEGEMYVKTADMEGSEGDASALGEDGTGSEGGGYDELFPTQNGGGMMDASGMPIAPSQDGRSVPANGRGSFSQNAVGSQQNSFVRNMAPSGKDAKNASGRAEMSKYMNNLGRSAAGYYPGMDGMVNLQDIKQRKIVEIRIFFDDGTFETFKGNE